MSYENYNSALKSGQKEYRACLLKGNYPYLPVLDEILSYTPVEYEVNIGLCEVPMELIVGTRTSGRTNSFAANFTRYCPSSFIRDGIFLYDKEITHIPFSDSGIYMGFSIDGSIHMKNSTFRQYM